MTSVSQLVVTNQVSNSTGKAFVNMFNQPELSNRPALWLGLRQVEAIKDSLSAALNCNPFPYPHKPADRKAWLKGQGITLSDDTSEESAIFLAMSNDIFARGSNAPKAEWGDLGAERSGAGWQNPANFLITSAFVRLLGASEQYQMDVLKALLYYRPLGVLGDKEDWQIIETEPHVIEEKPTRQNDKLVYQNPPIWNWVRKHAENCVERRKIFKNVFGLEIASKNDNKRLDDWYEKRNAIAHGRAGVTMRLKEYMDVEVFVAKMMLKISNFCADEMMLLV